jgi:urease accessory protein
MSLARLLQLASPTLPVGAYSYSQGLESAVDAGIVKDAASAERWISDVLEFSVSRTELPMLLRMINGEDLNVAFLATRETAEIRAETVQMGGSLTLLLKDLGVEQAQLEEPSFPAAFALAVRAWKIDSREAMVAYLWAWLENQVMAAIKAVPLGQTAGQKMLLSIGDRLEAMADRAMNMDETNMTNFAPGLAFLSSKHETQYSRLFRS